MNTVVPVDETCGTRMDVNGISRLGAKGTFVISRTNATISATFEWTSRSDVGNIPVELSDYVIQYFSRYYMEDTDEFSLPLFTEYRRQGQVFRAHPNYRKAIGPWYDWVLFRWRKEQRRGRRNRSNHAVDVSHMDQSTDLDEYDYAPARILGFVEINNEISCIVRPCIVTYTKSSVFSTQWELAFWDNKKTNPMISLVAVDSIVCHCLRIPQDGHHSTIFHEIWERKLWADEFHKC